MRFGNPWLVFTGEVNRQTRTCTQHSDCTTACEDDFGKPGYCENGYCNVAHGTQVAGAIGHSYGFLSPRHAPLVQVYNANNGNHNSDLDWLWDNDVYVENESWGGPSTSPYAQDYWALTGMVIAEIAGNANGSQTGPTCNTSCHAGNTICVGGYNSINPATMFDDSCSKNPTTCSYFVSGCDREEPTVVFRGQNVTTTTNNPGDADGLTSVSGTSYAGPAAVGFIALMFQKWGYWFVGYPELVKSALMASANKDIDTPVANKTYSDYQYPDERDGAGVPSAQRLESMMTSTPKKIWTDSLYKNSSFDSNDRKYLAYAYVPQNQSIRAVLSWSACPAAVTMVPGLANGAKADLDLQLVNSQGQIVATGASWDNLYEILEYKAPTSGYYYLWTKHHSWYSCHIGGYTVYAGLAYDVR